MEDSAGYGLNPAFGFNGFGFAPPGLATPNSTFGQVVATPDGTVVGTVPGLNTLQSVPAPNPFAPVTPLNPDQRDVNIDNMTIATPRGVDPGMTTQAPPGYGYPPSMQSISPQQSFQNSLLGMLADQQAVQQAMENLATPLGPPEGYQQAFEAPMSMEEALNATVNAMNPAMTDTSPDSQLGDPSTDVGDPGNQGNQSGNTSGDDDGEGGNEGGGNGAPGEGGGTEGGGTAGV